jgi:uncharacterized protein YbjT (DUF2867 family)
MILVTGATGNVGRELVAALVGSGVEVRAFARDRDKLSRLAAADIAVGDWDDQASVAAAFEDIDALFLLVPGIGVEHAARAVELAEDAGIGRIVLLSSYNVLGDPMPAMGRWHHERERLVAGSGIPFTILRPGGYMTNAFGWAETIREAGYVLDPVGPGRAALIDPADIAAVAALALIEEGHAGRRYVLTGEEPWTVAEQVAILGEAIGREIEVRTAASAEEALRFRYPDGAPPALAEALLEGLTLMRADTEGFRTHTARDLLGRRPATFRQWCERHAAAYRSLLQGASPPPARRSGHSPRPQQATRAAPTREPAMSRARRPTKRA